MSIPERRLYLANITGALRRHWPDNRMVNIVCHGHSVPAGADLVNVIGEMAGIVPLVKDKAKLNMPSSREAEGNQR